MPMATSKLVALLTPKRRWLQFRLKTIFVLVVIVAVPCMWLKSKMERKHKERAAVAEIKRLGGHVYYDWQIPDPDEEPPGPVWLRKLFGDDYFSSVWYVEILRTQFDDGWLVHQVNDEWLVHLEPLSDLTAVCIPNAKITDTGVQYLTRFKKISFMNLTRTKMTDAGLAHCNRLTGLKDLHVYETGVTAAGIADLQAALPKCKIHR
jgi:hypothetical protein